MPQCDCLCFMSGYWGNVLQSRILASLCCFESKESAVRPQTVITVYSEKWIQLSEVCHQEGKISEGRAFSLKHLVIWPFRGGKGHLYIDQRETIVGRKGKENSYYILWPGKTNPSAAKKLVWAGHKSSLMGRQRKLRGTRKTSGPESPRDWCQRRKTRETQNEVRWQQGWASTVSQYFPRNKQGGLFC